MSPHCWIELSVPGQDGIEDPVALTRTWKATIPYQRVAGLDRMVHGDCQENDRNPVVDGKLTIAPAN